MLVHPKFRGLKSIEDWVQVRRGAGGTAYYLCGSEIGHRLDLEPYKVVTATRNPWNNQVTYSDQRSDAEALFICLRAIAWQHYQLGVEQRFYEGDPVLVITGDHYRARVHTWIERDGTYWNAYPGTYHIGQGGVAYDFVHWTDGYWTMTLPRSDWRLIIRNPKRVDTCLEVQCYAEKGEVHQQHGDRHGPVDRPPGAEEADIRPQATALRREERAHGAPRPHQESLW